MKIHFIGIGGIGVSALAQYYLSQGHQVSGSDLVESEIIELLRKKGAFILIGRKAENLPSGLDLVVYSAAVQKDNPELKKGKGLGFTCLSYPQVLGRMTREYFTIAVSGTHGKSTTSTMIALILLEGGLNPTVIVGTKVKEFGNSNFRLGGAASDGKKYLVIEADEWDRSFLNYWPQIIVLTNIEEEHMDTYQDLEDILKTYRKYLQKLPASGALIFNGQDANIAKALEGLDETTWQKIPFEKNQELGFNLAVPGEHNRWNALAALKTVQQLGVAKEKAEKALSQFRGTWRRLEEKEAKLGNKEIKIISDYAHHPTEIKATLQAVREKYPKASVYCIFQPHQRQRTHYLFEEFKETLKTASKEIDEFIITDIYDVPGREEETINQQVSGQKLVEAIDEENVLYLAKDKLTDYLRKHLKGGEITLIMGAGDIYDLFREFSTG